MEDIPSRPAAERVAFIFAGLEMAAVYAVLGAVVGEFVGGQSGLGVLILNRNAVLDISVLSALVLLGFMGVEVPKRRFRCEVPVLGSISGQTANWLRSLTRLSSPITFFKTVTSIKASAVKWPHQCII